MEIEVEVLDLVENLITGEPGVMLEAVQSKAQLIIFIGPAEAQAIGIVLAGAQISRPMTHDTLKNIFVGFNAKVLKVVVHDFKENVFYAEIYVEQEGRLITFDCRPSDAIALALRYRGVPYIC